MRLVGNENRNQNGSSSKSDLHSSINHHLSRFSIYRSYFCLLFLGVSLFILVWIFTESDQVNIVVGEKIIEIILFPKSYSKLEISMVSMFTVIATCSLIALFQGNWDKDVCKSSFVEWDDVINNLQGPRRNILVCIVQAGGAIRQSDIVLETGLSKSSVSRNIR